MSRDRLQSGGRTIAMYVAPVPNALLVSVPDANLLFTHASDDPEGLDALVRTAAANLHGVAKEQLHIETYQPADVLSSDVLAGVVGDVTRIGADGEMYTSEQALALCMLMTTQHLKIPPIERPPAPPQVVRPARLHLTPTQPELDETDCEGLAK
jgi:hypothetical protein